jgi:hypothetical protein
VDDDLAELVGASIYRAQRRWLEIRMIMHGGRRKGRALVQWFRVLSRGELTGDDLTAVRSHDDATGVFGYVAQGRATAVLRRAYLLKPQSRGYGGNHRSGVQRTGGGDDLFTPRRYPTIQARIPTPVTRIAAEGVVGGEGSRAGDLIHFSYCTIAQST